jgi:hypothetical protein
MCRAERDVTVGRDAAADDRHPMPMKLQARYQAITNPLGIRDCGAW